MLSCLRDLYVICIDLFLEFVFELISIFKLIVVERLFFKVKVFVFFLIGMGFGFLFVFLLFFLRFWIKVLVWWMLRFLFIIILVMVFKFLRLIRVCVCLVDNCFLNNSCCKFFGKFNKCNRLVIWFWFLLIICVNFFCVWLNLLIRVWYVFVFLIGFKFVFWIFLIRDSLNVFWFVKFLIKIGILWRLVFCEVF